MDARHLAELKRRFRLARDYPTGLELEAAINPRTVSTPALRLIATELNWAFNTPDARLAVSIPPQEGKTQLARASVVRHLAINPHHRIAYASYADDLALEHGRWIRDTINTHPWLGIKVARGHAQVANWSLSGHDGGVVSVGIGSGLTGKPVDVMMIDDPVKDREQADSKVYRERLWGWYNDVALTRLPPSAPVVIIMTRWHEDDLVGRLLASESRHRWREINIAAQAGANDPLGRAPGQWLESARGRSTSDWEQKQADVRPRTWQALYQGRPSPAEGGIFQRSWWRHWTPATLPRMESLTQSWDLAFKGTATSDYVVGQVWGRHGTDAYLLDQVRGRWAITETLRQMRALTEKWPAALGKLVEDKANGPAVIDLLRSDANPALRVGGLIPIQPQGGKESRANAASPLVEAGNVYLPPASAYPWVDELIEEAAAFPNGANDDQVDALTQYIIYDFVTRAEYTRVGGLTY